MMWGMDNSKQKCHDKMMTNTMKKYAKKYAKKYVILLNGELTVTDRLKQQITGSQIVAADGGMRHAEALDVCPVLWIGDFDSSDGQLQKKWRHVPRETYPADKDQTDGELAIEFALKNGAQEIVLVGGLGGRTDQSVGHLMQLIKLRQQNIKCFISSGIEEAWPLLCGRTKMDFPPHTRLSIVGLTDIEGLDLKGVKWPLENVEVELGSTLTISNEVVDMVSIEVKSGYGIIVARGPFDMMQP